MELIQWILARTCRLQMIRLQWLNKFLLLNPSISSLGRRSFLFNPCIFVSLTLCLFLPRLNYAQPSWVKYYRTNGAEFFYNPASIKKSSNLDEINVFILSNYIFPTRTGEKSVVVRQRIDCNRGRYKILAFKSFSKKNGKGKMIISNGLSKRWMYIVSRTPDAILQRIVCSG